MHPQEELKFSQHPGYEAIMAALPRAYVAVCANARTDGSFPPAKAALASLVKLYDYLLSWEQDVPSGTEAKYVYKPNVVAARDFSMAVELLLHRLATMDPRCTRENAIHVAGLVELYATSVGNAAEESLLWARSSYC